MAIRYCRLCGSESLILAVDLGHHPPADTFLPPAALAQPETFYPLRVLLCTECGFVGLEFIVPARDRYQKVDYSYTASNSPMAVKHFNELAGDTVAEVDLHAGDLAVDIGGNDGTLLRELRTASGGCAVLNVEPAANIADLAEGHGVPTHTGFFDTGAVKVIQAAGCAKLISATNVLNHVTDPHTFLDDLTAALAPDGVFVLEVPYLPDLIAQCAFDTIYLEHVSYFGASTLAQLLRAHGLHITKAARTPYMGGSIRVHASRVAGDGAADFIEQEQSAGLASPATYAAFSARIRRFRTDLCTRLFNLKQEGATIVGIGAAAKGNTLLNYCGIDGALLESVADSSPLKIGKVTPGSHLPIVADSAIPVDATHGLILPWNIGAFLKERLRHLGLEFIVPQMKT